MSAGFFIPLKNRGLLHPGEKLTSRSQNDYNLKLALTVTAMLFWRVLVL
jgi:hypothetical protein